MSMRRLSVIVTTHFRDAVLKECLDSLAAQTVPLHEVVVVDDGGSGSAREVVEQSGPRFRYLWQPNRGMQSARNHGARASTGEWIAFLDDDDLWLPERHTRVAELMATDQVDLISGDFTKFGDGWVAQNGVFDEIAQQSPGFWDGLPREPGATHSIIGSFPTTRLLPVYPFWPSTLAIRRDLFDRLNGWNEDLRGIKSEDIDFVFRAIKHGRLGLIWTPTVYYRSHSGNDSRSSLAVSLGRVHVWEHLLLSQELTAAERYAFGEAINNSRHEILHSAFSQKEYEAVQQVSKRIGSHDLTIPEKTKLLVARAISGISRKKYSGIAPKDQ